MKKLIFIFFSILLQANVINIYRTQGQNNAILQMDKILTSKMYWKIFLKNKNTKFGYYESINHLLFCNKTNKSISIFDTKNNFKEIFNYPVFVGKVDGDKQFEGDLKTPIGTYVLTNKLNNVDSFYGPFALVTSYPNDYDKLRGKTGHGIWIHGLPFKGKRDDFTKGCIAIENDKLRFIDNKINLKKSVLIISDKNNIEVNKEDIINILSEIFKWRYAWKYNDIDTYLSFYSKNFKKKYTINFNQFKQYKTKLFALKQKKEIIFKTIDIMPNPTINNKKIFKVVIYEIYKSNTTTFKGIKEIFLELNNSKIKILTEN